MKAVSSIFRIVGALLAINGLVSENGLLGLLVGAALVVLSYYIQPNTPKS